MSVRVGITLDRDRLVKWLSEHGYTRLDGVEDAGDFAVRWGDRGCLAAGEADPVRIDFFGDQVESVHRFDLESLGPKENVTEARRVGLGGSDDLASRADHEPF